MTTLADSLISSTSRAVKLRMRPDLTARKHRYQGQSFWVVKEPIGLNYFRFHEEEFAILNMLDGRTSLDEIKENFEAEFTPQKITFGDLQQFVGMLHRNGLVISEASGQGKQLRRRRDEKKRREFMGMLANVFAIRFRGVDPERFLTWLYKYTGWFFTWPCVLCVMFFAFTALMLVMSQYDTFVARLPTFHQFFGPRNWFYLAIVMGVVKIFHEFGHGLSCKHFGGECHELGAMLLVFTPALYCNVSDSWMLPNKYHRAAIGAAGMYVEIFIASLATYVWWYSQPGLINQLSLSVIFICSVSTVMFNGNPLLRFDGYYILMDLAEIPNLRQKSTEVLRRYLTELCLGLEQPESPFLPQRNKFFFGLYTIAAELYRLMVVFSILFFLNQVFEPYGLKIIGQIIGFTGVIGLFIHPIWSLIQFFYIPGRMNKVKSNRVYVTLAVVALFLAGMFYIPLPHAVHCTFEIIPHDAANIYPATPGFLAEKMLVKPGDTVQKDMPIAKLSNVELELQLAERQGAYEKAKAALNSINAMMSKDTTYAGQLKSAREAVVAAEQLLLKTQEEQTKLTILAPRDGIVLPPPYRPEQKAPQGRLSPWTGSPFDAKNSGARFERTDLLCRVGNPRKMEAVLIIDQTDIDLVKPHGYNEKGEKIEDGNEVRLLTESYVQKAFSGRIESVAKIDLKEAPTGLATQAGGDLNTVVDETTGKPRPLSTSYQARVSVDDADGVMLSGLRGQARIYTGWQSLGQRLYRYVIRTFNFHL
jgi:putative peptide zinc metalloprotease protein